MKRSLYLALPCGLLALYALAHAGERPTFKLTEAESKLLELTNQERKKKDLPALRHSALLSRVARAHSANMGKQADMKHELDGKTPFDRMRAAGYQFTRGGENIAAGDPSFGLPAVLRMWMESKPHRENILNRDFTEIGIGIADGKDGQKYYTQVFGTPRVK
jgi:uncharacterized protein YkwD